MKTVMMNKKKVMYCYRKNRFKRSGNRAASNRVRRLQDNIVIHFPGLRSSANAKRKASSVDTWKYIFNDGICKIILQLHKIA